MCIFALGPATVPRSFFVSPICLPLSLPPLSAGFPLDALNFKFRATTVSTVAATTDFRVFPPAYALSFVSVAPIPSAARLYVTDTAIYGAVSPHFYLWRHPVCIRIDSVIYFAADSDARGSAASRHEKANFETAFRSPSRRALLRAT